MTDTQAGPGGAPDAADLLPKAHEAEPPDRTLPGEPDQDGLGGLACRGGEERRTLLRELALRALL
jgi:hypothetical protein